MSSIAVAPSRIYLIDAHAYLHRAYHALPPLKNSSGEPVGALYGFVRMILGLVRREKPEFVAVCLDAPGPTFRHAAYAAYKATRKEVDEDLKSQLVLARPLAEGLGFKCAQLPGYEADDLMATLAAEARERGLDVVLVTSDKDAMQLVAEHVRVLNESKGLVFDAARVREKFGVAPARFVDYLALVGDASDNVPGVPGIGPAGAAKLLDRYESLDALLSAARAKDKGLPPKTAQALREYAEQALFGRRLIALDAAVPVGFDVQECRAAPAPGRCGLELLRRFEFHSLIRELSSVGEDRRFAAAAPSPDTIAPAMALKDWLAAAAGTERVALACVRMARTELLGDSPWALALSLPDGRAAWAEAADLKLPALAKLLAGPAMKTGHDLKSALTLLKRAGVEAGGPRRDALLAAWCLDPEGRHDFVSLAAAHGLGAAPKAKGDPKPAALWQARSVWALAGRLEDDLNARGLWKLYAELELPLLDVLADMEAEGVGVDGKYLRDLRVEFEGLIEDIKRAIDGLAGAEVNLNSPKQLARLLFEDMRLPVVHKTPKGGASTDEETLLALRALHPLPTKLIDYRELAKLKSTYIEGLLERIDPRSGRVHTHFNQAGTATGRLSSLNPNLQNIPIRTPLGQKIRRAFVARPGHVLLSADYSQIDLRLLAHLSGDPALVEAFRKGEDVHLRTACEISGVPPEKVDAELRRRAKAVNFGIVYGQTPHGLSQELGIPQAKAKEYIDLYFGRYSGVARWIKTTLETARRDGSVRTLLGRVRSLPDLAAKNAALRQFNERVAVNTPIQGSSADIIKAAMLAIRRRTLAAPGKWKSRLVLQVHDELVFETPEAELDAFGRWAQGEMQSALRLKVPLVVDLKAGTNWRDMRSLP